MKRSIAESESAQNKKLKPTPTSTSASSSAADLPGKYQVFLSFRGPDTRRSFTDYLYEDLVGAGIHTFIDNEELRIGEEIGPNLVKAIEDSKISIPIFSKNYADSKWCLSELALMVKCQADEGRKIFPIFYDVDVSDVKNQKGSYEKAFRQHEENFKEETVKEWREALKTVGELKGYELEKETKGHEGKLVKKLVKDVLLELKKNYADVSDDLVGMDHHVQEMIRLLQVDSDGARIVGIHGMGGIGKTTIAKVIYNLLCESFEYCCFLEDVRERAEQHRGGLVDLQKELVFQILKRDFPDIVNVSDGLKKIEDVVHQHKVLIVLDDVDEKSQFDKLAGECNWLDKASRIIVTTRNKDVLNKIKATCSAKGLLEAYRSYEPELMTDGYSLKLFSKYAFRRESPPKDYFILSQKVMSIAVGLPLVLVTLGSLFWGTENKASWSAKLKKLEKVPAKDVMGKLRISFDALDDDDKKIFLDIACLFIGEDKAKAYYMWEGYGFVPEDGINTLILRSLVKVGDDSKLRMHDQLRDLGRQIVREENMYKLSRIWCPKEALEVVEGHLVAQGVKCVEALILDVRVVKEDEYVQLQLEGEEYEKFKTEGKEYYIRRLEGENFNKLSNLRFLRLGSVILDGDFKNLFPKLSWLKWRCWMKCIPVNLNLKNLVILDLSNSTITYKWEGWTLFKAATKLKVLDLSGCRRLTRGPDIIATFVSLENLDLSCCYSLERLPDSLIPGKLKKLCLCYCRKLQEIEGLSSLVSLEHLDIRAYESIERLSGLSNLGKLKILYLNDCKELREIEGLSSLVSLEVLNMTSCVSIVRLPDISNLRMLRKLILNCCEKLREVGGLGGLVSLEHLDLNWCESIERLPGLSNLRKLKRLFLNYCKELREIKGLSSLVSLEFLDMSMYEFIVRSPDMLNLRMLRVLHLNDCTELREVRGLGGLVSLEHLDISLCESIERLPGLSNLGKLKILYLNDCKELQEIEVLAVWYP